MAAKNEPVSIVDHPNHANDALSISRVNMQVCDAPVVVDELLNCLIHMYMMYETLESFADSDRCLPNGQDPNKLGRLTLTSTPISRLIKTRP